MPYDKDQILYRTCQVIVNLFRNQIEEERECVHTRIFNFILHPEHEYVHCGISDMVCDSTKKHPEHVVPCLVLVNETFRLIKEKILSDDEIARLLQKHWKIVTITKEEAKRIDSKLCLKSKMPEGWKFEDGDTFKRLNLAGIKYK